MTSPDFLPKLLVWAQHNGVNFTVTYTETDDVFEVRVFSAASSENFYRKRCYTFDMFLQCYNERPNK